MKYIILESPKTNAMKLSDDNLSINIDVTVTYNIEGGSSMPNGSTGYTINLLLDDSLRSSMLSELISKTQVLFDAQFNPVV